MGRQASPSELIAQANKELEALELRKAKRGGGFAINQGGAAFGNASGAADAAREQLLKNQIAGLKETQQLEQRSADTQAEKKRLSDATQVTEKLIEGSLSNQQKLAKELVKNRNEFLAAGVSESALKGNKDFQAVNAASRKRYTESGSAGTGESEVAQIKAKTLAQREYFALLQEKGAQADSLTEGQKLVIKIQQELKTSINGVSRAQKERALVEAQQLSLIDVSIQSEKKRIAAVEKSRLEYVALTDSVDKSADALRQQAIDQEAANASSGKSKTAIRIEQLKELQKILREIEPKNNLEESYAASLQNKADQLARVVESLKSADFVELTRQQTEYSRQLDEQAKLYQDELALTGLSR